MGKPTLWGKIRGLITGFIWDHMPAWMVEIGFLRMWTDVVPEDERYMERFSIAEIYERWSLRN